MSIPLNPAIIAAVSGLIDDGRGTPRQPSHSELDTLLASAKIEVGDPTRKSKDPVGKRKRVRGALQWALENNRNGGTQFVLLLLGHLRGCGAFRSDSPNFAGDDPIGTVRTVFKHEGYNLTEEGELLPLLLDNLQGAELTEALRIYVRRAIRGATDAALVTGTGKDLLEATAAHVLVKRYGQYSTSSNFPTLLGQAFTALDLTAVRQASMTAQQSIDCALYDLACGVNRLRNREGTGHGRPFLPNVAQQEARIAIAGMGIVAERLLDALDRYK